MVNERLATCPLAALLIAALGMTSESAAATRHHWPLDDGRGNAARNVTAAGPAGRVHGKAMWMEQCEGLRVLTLDGRDDYLEVAHHADLRLDGDFTLSLWLAVHSRHGPVGVVVKSGALRLLYDAPRGRFVIDIAGATRTYETFPAKLKPGQWHHLALSRGAAEGKTEVFLDGRRVAQFDKPAGPLADSKSPLRVGVGINLEQKRFLPGAVAELRFDPRALTHEEIQRMADDMDERLDGDRELALPLGRVRDSRWPLLLVDTTQLALNEGASLTVCEAVRHPANPVVRLGGPGSVDEDRAQFGGSVYHIDGKFRMWYSAFPGGPAYAESDDGIHWTKPKLGLKEFRGSKDNNLVPMPGRAMIFYDPSDPDRRFKKPVSKPNPSQGNRDSLWTWAHSKDGFHWTLADRPTPDRWENAEAQMLARVDERWVIYTQGLSHLGRTVMAFSSPTLDTPTWEWAKQAVWTLKDKYPLYQTHHGISPWPRPGLTIGICGIFLDRHELIDTTVDLGLVLSHDGLEWWEPWPLATILRRGNAGEWDSTFLIQGCPSFVNVRDKTYLYYSGEDTGNVGDRMQIGLAMLRRDGFGYQGIDVGWTYARPGPRTGRFVTAAIRLNEKATERVLLNVENVDAAKGQFVQVEVLDARGKPIPGFTLADADRVTAEGIAAPATWRGSATLAGAPDIIRLRVHMQGGRRRRASPRVYAIYFTEPTAIEQ